MREPTGALLDLENLFHWHNFRPGGEYDAAHTAGPDGEGLRQEVQDVDYPLYHKAASRHPELWVVPRYVDLLVSWLAASYSVELRRAFGKTHDPGVMASRERLRAHDWGFTPAGDEPGAADELLLRALGDASRNGRFEVYVVGSSDSKRTTGILVRASRLITLARRLRPGSRLVVVQGPRITATSSRARWSSAEDLGEVDEVYLLSRIVHNELRHRRTKPSRSPRGDMPRPPSPHIETRRRWRRTVAEWAVMDDTEVGVDLTARLRGLDAQQLARAFANLDHALRDHPTETRARLRPLAGRVVNDLIEAGPAVPAALAAPGSGIATTPMPRQVARRVVARTEPD